MTTVVSNDRPCCVELRIDSDGARLAPARRAAEAFARDCGFDPSSCGDIGLCLNEALANVLRHAYLGVRGRPIAITLEDLGDGIRITIRDWGTGLVPNMRMDEDRDLLRPGGVGLICMRQLMDEIVFRPQTDGMLLTMIRQKRRFAAPRSRTGDRR